MDLKRVVMRGAEWIHPRIISSLFKCVEPIPAVKKRIEGEYKSIMGELEKSVKPYRDRALRFQEIPDQGLPRQDVLEEMRRLKGLEDAKWKEGFVSGAVYHGDEYHIGFLNADVEATSKAITKNIVVIVGSATVQ
ncbi:MAG: hypothetical protein JRI71_02700 [Deltaproteobacteria bacterium]|nr:hypothetical protein [Deltaproteobacteria bacterium]